WTKKDAIRIGFADCQEIVAPRFDLSDQKS
ncbi:hypothetical protein Tco_0690886, partial [Tanacetum coccineum]